MRPRIESSLSLSWVTKEGRGRRRKRRGRSVVGSANDLGFAPIPIPPVEIAEGKVPELANDPEEDKFEFAVTI